MQPDRLSPVMRDIELSGNADLIVVVEYWCKWCAVYASFYPLGGKDSTRDRCLTTSKNLNSSHSTGLLSNNKSKLLEIMMINIFLTSVVVHVCCC